jgi:chromosome segregation protein
LLQPGISIDATGFHSPIYFGQKDLSNKGKDFEGDLIQRLIGTRLKAVQVKLSKRKEKLNLLFQN